jgi:flavin reductase (DIM6/NTAB) family NADH-FMN oxidoreductase RutF
MEALTRTNVVDQAADRTIARLLLSAVVPRPIAWVLTQGADGSCNLAPFSFFNAVASLPPTIMVSVAERAGRPKDTLRNIGEVGEFVVHLVDERLAEAMNVTAAEVAYGVDEVALAGLATVPAALVRPPRLAAAAVALECRLLQALPIQETRYTMVLGRVVQFHVRQDLLTADELIDAERLRPIARLGADDYTTLGRGFTMIRPAG